MHKAWIEIASVCLSKSKHPNDIIVCSQNGSFDFANNPMIGLGEDGFAGFQSLNHIAIEGLKYLTHDNTIIQEKVYEPNILEDSIHFEMKQYQNIWENIYFLRILTQIVNIGNGLHYDWWLSMLKIQNARRVPEHIRDKIKKRLNVFPLFSKIFDNAYIGQIRNAAAHNQYQVVQGGVIFYNYMSDKYSTLQGVSFEEWDEIYCNAYCSMNFIIQYLKYYANEISKISNLPHNAVEIIIPDKNRNWYKSYIAPTNVKRDGWHFINFD